MTDDCLTGSDSVTRCRWPGNDKLYISYHDEEWGFPETDNAKLFEKISLEGFQSGLSWITILRKRENFRKAFCDFNLEIVSKFGEKKIKALLSDEGIVRHEGKIRSVINNSQRALQLIEEQGSLAQYFYSQSQLVEGGDCVKKSIPSQTETFFVDDKHDNYIVVLLGFIGFEFFFPPSFKVRKVTTRVDDHIRHR